MKKIGFFGGSFNPVTVAHINLIKKAIEEFNLDKVYFVPMNDYYKKLGLISAEERYKMLSLALEDEPKMQATRLLIDIEKPTSAIDTFRLIEEKYKDSDNYFIMGSDNFNKIEKWKASEELKNNYKYIILNREKDRNFEASIEDIKMKNISSSLVRKNVKEGKDIKALVPRKVEIYILKSNLYK